MPNQISVQNLSKRFLVPHQRRTTLKESFVEVIKNLIKKETHEEFFALKDINLHIKQGEFIGIIGPNGSGKSTLLKLLAGIYKAESGQVNINGRIAPLLELGIGFQQDLSARDNIFINAALLGLSTKETRKLLPSIIDFAEIGHFIDQKVKNYSSGMRQRLGFAIAAHIDADIYLCDEVFAVGDANFQSKCVQVFENWQRAGKTILLVSHNTNQIAVSTDRAILMKEGEILADGDSQHIIELYQQMVV